MLNEEKYILNAINSLINNDYPSDKIEILVYDGGSSDNSIRIVKDLSQKNRAIKLKHNPDRVQVNALNQGIRDSDGSVIVRADAHCLYQKDYVSKCVCFLINGKADNVGGRQLAAGESYITEGIAKAFSSMAGSGGAAYRTSQQEQFTDTVFLGSWLKSTLISLEGFDSRFKINEDYELNIRLRKSGGKVLFSPEIETVYFVRSSFNKLARQYYSYGYWKVLTDIKHPGYMKPRQTIVPIGIGAVVLSVAAYLMTSSPLFAIIPVCYISFCSISALFPSPKTFNIKYFPVTLAAIFIMHFSWGLGFFCSQVGRITKNRFFRNAPRIG